MMARSGPDRAAGARRRAGKRTEHRTLGYPKYTRPRRRQRHKASILQAKDGSCYLCFMLRGDSSFKPVLHTHHIFGGSRRKKSEAEGLKVYLCPEHHMAVHKNSSRMRYLQITAQTEYERTHSREQWMQLMGKNYLTEE